MKKSSKVRSSKSRKVKASSPRKAKAINPMNDIALSPMNAHDLEVLLEKFIKKIENHRMEYMIVSLKKGKQIPKEERYFTFIDKNTSLKMTGYLDNKVYRKGSSYKQELCFILEQIEITNKAQRGKGYFKVIIIYLEDFCRDNNIILMVTQVEDDLVRRLEKNGYTIIDMDFGAPDAYKDFKA